MARVSDGRHGDKNAAQGYRDHEKDEGGGGRGSSTPWASGRDAAYIKPRLVPDYELLPRDDSGGPEWDPYTAEFGDGGYVTGDKKHLSAHGGEDDAMINDVVSDEPRTRTAKRDEGERSVSPNRPARSAKEAKEE